MLDNLETALKTCVSRGNLVWNDYLTQGPGIRNDKQTYSDLVAATDVLRSYLERISTGHADAVLTEDTVATLSRLLDILCDLADRCVNRSEGLCFITGEAGLVPRQDLHEKFENTLKQLETLAEQGV